MPGGYARPKGSDQPAQREQEDPQAYREHATERGNHDDVGGQPGVGIGGLGHV